MVDPRNKGSGSAAAPPKPGYYIVRLRNGVEKTAYWSGEHWYNRSWPTRWEPPMTVIRALP